MKHLVYGIPNEFNEQKLALIGNVKRAYDFRRIDMKGDDDDYAEHACSSDELYSADNGRRLKQRNPKRKLDAKHGRSHRFFYPGI